MNNNISNLTYKDVNTALISQKDREVVKKGSVLLAASIVAVVALVILIPFYLPSTMLIPFCIIVPLVLGTGNALGIKWADKNFQASIDNIIKASLNSYKNGKFDNQEDQKKLFALADTQTLIDLCQIPVGPVGPPPAYTPPEKITASDLLI